MLVKNYPQFAKKTFFMGLSRPFVIIYLFGCSFIFLILSVLSLNSSMIISMVLAIFGYCFFVGKFKLHPYWFDKFCLKASLAKQYKFLAKFKIILSR